MRLMLPGMLQVVNAFDLKMVLVLIQSDLEPTYNQLTSTLAYRAAYGSRNIRYLVIIWSLALPVRPHARVLHACYVRIP
jgi:hypothetical protein